MRASDAVKAVRSYVVFNTAEKGLHVKESHWKVGYTPAYCSTPIEAIDHAIEKAEQEMTASQAKVVELHDLRATVIAEAHHVVDDFRAETGPIDLTKYDDEGVPYTDSKGKNLEDGWG